MDKKYKHNKSESNLLNYHQTEKKYIGTNININFNKDKDKEKVYKNVIDSMTKESKRYQNVANSKKYVNRSMQTTPDQNIKPYVRECYSMLKSIYLSIKEKEKQYNNNFNYDKTEYENINYSICYIEIMWSYCLELVVGSIPSSICYWTIHTFSNNSIYIRLDIIKRR